MRCGLAILVVTVAGLSLGLPAGPVARWEFDGTLADGSGNGHDAVGTGVAYVEAGDGKGLAAGHSVSCVSAPDLRLFPQFELHCRFRLDARAEGPQVLVQKDKEYLLRVDWEKEGGEVSFFAFANGAWEPRVRGFVPKLGTWYEIKASWDGGALVLEAADGRWSVPRKGMPAPTTNPVVIGPIQGVIDRLEIRNAGYRRQQALSQLKAATADEMGTDTRRFGATHGWVGWRAGEGATMRVREGALVADITDPSALISSPVLALPAVEAAFVSLDVESSPGAVLGLNFVSDEGVGSVTFIPAGSGRTSLVNASEHPAWTGTIRRLALSRMDGGGSSLICRNLAVSNVLEGPPYLIVRSLAPERAKLRPGQPERFIAVVKNLGGAADAVRVTLSLAAGVRSLDGVERTVETLAPGAIELLTWTLQSERPVATTATVRCSVAGGRSAKADWPLHFEARPDVPHTGYVPVPQPATTDYLGLMHYCALWKEGTHYGWGKIEPWPERRPAIGYYDEGTPEVADWHIKTALEHGISGFIYCWYRTDLSPEIHQMLGHAIHEGLYEARYRDRFKFTIMWENGCAEGVKDADDLLQNLFPFWMENYFTHPSYLTIDNCPVLVVWRPERVGPQLGGTAATRATFEAMRTVARGAGFAGLRIIGCLDQANGPLQKRMAEEGWDATTGYGLVPAGERIVGTDIEGIPTMDHAASMRLSKDAWLARREAGSLPDIPNVMMGWDPRPWHGDATASYRANARPENFEAACRDAKDLVDEAPADAWYRRLVVFDNWTEFGEGHYIEPTSGTGFDYVNAIKRVFCARWAPEALTDIIPEDAGLVPPQSRYLARRELYGGMPWRARVIRDHTIAWWRFDGGNDAVFLDASSSCFHLVRQNASLVPGKSGMAMACGEGWGNHPTHPAFFPADGISITLWCNPSVADQSDAWMVNTVGNATTGYRLGLSAGHPAWQVPREVWSHNLSGPDALPVGVWTHVAATFDNRVMRLYVGGRLVGELPRPGLIRPSQADMNVGTFAGARARFQGQLDDVRVWDRPLTAEEVAASAAR